MVVCKQLDNLKTSKNALHCWRKSQFIANLDVNIGWNVSTSINGSDETHICKSLWLNRGLWIEDGPVRFCHVMCEEETHEMSSV